MGKQVGRNGWLALSLALGLVVVVVTWISNAERDPARSALPSGAPEPAARPAPAPLLLPPAVAREPEPEPAAEAGAERAALRGTQAEELVRAMWVEGRVLFPPGTPLDEEAFVEARGKKFGDGSRHRARVAADGGFRVAFPERAKSGWLVLEARYARLAPHFRWLKSETAPIVLAPELGGSVEGRLVPPEGTSGATIGGTVGCRPERLRRDLSIFGEESSVEVDRDLAFAFGGLASGDAYFQYEGEDWWAEERAARVEPGRVVKVELELHRGVTLAGRVVDADGQPLGGVDVHVFGRPSETSIVRTTETALDGRFGLRGLPHAGLFLTASLAGHVDASRTFAALTEGEVRTDLELVLGAGAVVAGRVTFPDGSPAQAVVRVVPAGDALAADAEADAPDSRGEVETAADGSFRLAGLGAGPFDVHARSERAGASQPSRFGRPTWRGVARDVRGDATDVALVLEEGLVLSGRVVDDLGAPVALAFLVGQPGGMEAGPLAFFEERVFEPLAGGSDGAFAVSGFARGRWRLDISSEGYLSVEGLEVDLPAATPLVVVLRRGARVSGVVEDEAGAPVPDAWVYTEAVQFSRSAQSDARGAFELTGLAAGPVTLKAHAEGFASSAPLELELQPAEQRGGALLRLRAGGRIRGEVLDREGLPFAGVGVSVAGASDPGAFDESDAAGRFELTGVAPGETRIVAWTAARLELSAHATVVVGETVNVRLQVPATSVRLHGRVTIAGAPAAGVTLTSRLRDAQTDGPWCLSGEGGAYALELPAPGSYWISVWDQPRGTQAWIAVEVPPGEELALDLDLPVGRVSGRVFDRGGGPLAGVKVVASQTADRERRSGWGNVTTDVRGAYELLLAPGVYEVGAGGHGGDDDPGRSFVRSAVPDVVVASGTLLRGIDLELAEGGALEGVVRWGDGAPAASAWLWIGARGPAVESDSLGQTDARGRFRFEGLAPGAFVVTATLDRGTAEWAAVELAPGKVPAVELVLAASSWLEVRVRDGSGADVVADVEALDEREKRFVALPQEGGVLRMGPLLAGRYRVQAKSGERTAHGEVVVTGAVETVTLALTLP